MPNLKLFGMNTRQRKMTEKHWDVRRFAGSDRRSRFENRESSAKRTY